MGRRARFGRDGINYAARCNNYLLRSRHSESLRRIMVLVGAGRVRISGHGSPIIVTADGAWAGNCDWEIRQLERRGLVERREYLDPTAPVTYGMTIIGARCALGADCATNMVGVAAVVEAVDRSRMY